MDQFYDPKSYWDKRLQANFNLRGVGHISFSEFYNKWLYRKKKYTIELFFKNKILCGKNVLDIGCGTGFFVDWYLKRGANVAGIDIVESSIMNLSQRFKDVRLEVADITSDDYISPGRFDIINMWDVIYHIVDEKLFIQALRNIASSCNYGAILLFTDCLGASTDFLSAPHVKFRCLNTYQKMLSSLGFQLIKILPLYKFLNIPYRILGRLSNYLAPLYYVMDLRIRKIPENNLSLSVWKFK